MAVNLDLVAGDATGVLMPAHPEALSRVGTGFLTEAFRAYGALAQDNTVTAITRCEPCHDGNSGLKLFLSVEYARADPGLHNDLFVKFSRHFGDRFRDRRKYELEAEVRLASLSRHPAFPVPVAVPYFADFNRESGSGVLITQQIAFGRDGIEPMRPKNMDHELDNPLEYYQATLSALARLMAAHSSGALSPEVEKLFPFDQQAAAADIPIPLDEAQIRDKVAQIGTFIADCPNLFPESLAEAGFISRLERDAVRFLKHESAVRQFLHADPRFIVLTHWNTHIDNGWFWRDETGTLQCGLLDWGMVRQMNVAFGLWGGLCGATATFLEDNVDRLLEGFGQEVSGYGGPQLTVAEIGLHFDLSAVMLGLALMMDAPALLRSRQPLIASASGLLDPILREDKVVQGILNTFVVFLDLWNTRDFGASLDRMLATMSQIGSGAVVR